MRYFYQNLDLILKRLLIIFCFLQFGQTLSAQKLHLKAVGKSEIETKIIDSIGYNPDHDNAKSIINESNAISEKLIRIGYIENEIFENKKTNDSTFLFQYSLGRKTNSIHIYIGSHPELQSLGIFDSKKDTLVMPLSEAENFMNQTLFKLEKKGYALSKLQLKNIRKNRGHLEAELFYTAEKKRQLNDIVINGYPKFPEGHKANIRRMYRNQVFNQENLKNLHDDFEKFRFVKQTKYPEILFSKDSTKIYVYLDKTKANTFDGFIGFGNNEQGKVIFNGYLDLVLNNILNTGETFTLYWKSDGNEQKTFNAAIELPYIFRSPFGLKAQLNIFKQDSTFQNTKTAIDLGYFFNYNTRLYLGYQSTESSDIQNTNNALISDYKNSFLTTNFEFYEFKPEDFLFPEKTKMIVKAGIGSRNSKFNTNSQFFLNIEANHNIALNKKNSFFIKTQNYYLSSEQYITNELYRFGGINSIRGFNENSLQANAFASVLTEYRYVLAPTIYAHTIIDYGYYQDKTSDGKGDLLGIGFGFGLLTKNGLFNIIYANGSSGNDPIKLSNSIVHISFKTNF